MAMATEEDTESLLESSRAEVRSLWGQLRDRKLKRAELNQKMTEFLDQLMVNRHEIYERLEPELPTLRVQVLGDKQPSEFEF